MYETARLYFGVYEALARFIYLHEYKCTSLHNLQGIICEISN